VTQKHSVDIKLKNFFFRQALLDFQRQENFRELPDERLIQG
jgi:hypothetical protein